MKKNYKSKLHVHKVVLKFVNPFRFFSIFLHKYNKIFTEVLKVDRLTIKQMRENIILGHLFIKENDPITYQ